MLLQRVLTGMVLAPAVVLSVWLGPPWFTLMVGAGAVVGCWEFYCLTATPRTLLPLGAALSLALGLSPLTGFPHTLDILLTITVLLTLTGALLGHRAGGLGGWGAMMAGPLYTGYLLGLWLALRLEADGREWVLFGLMVVFISDTAAYFIGRLWGHRKLAPYISPGKTWVGTVGGLVAAGISAALLSALTPLTVVTAVILGLLLSLAGQIGDLSESYLKRSAGAKDSSGLLPGHGGLLDRMDSIVFAGALLYHYVIWIAPPL